MPEKYDINSIQSLDFREGVRTRIHKTCERCANCYKEYMLGGYPTPVCKIYGYLEEIDNPHHDLDGEKCSDYTYPMVKDFF